MLQIAGSVPTQGLLQGMCLIGFMPFPLRY
jgi:hypothetical protein